MSLTELLGQHLGLQALDPEGQSALMRHAEVRFFQRNHTLWEQGRIDAHVGVLLTGRLKLVERLEDGLEQILDLPPPGSLVGALDSPTQPLPHRIQSLSQGAVALFQRAQLETLLGTDGAGEFLAAAAAASRDRQAIRRLDLAGQDARTRLAAALHRLALTDGETVPGGCLLTLPLSRQDLAALAGSSLEETVLLMSRWNREQVVQTDRHGLLIPDLVRLRFLAGPDA